MERFEEQGLTFEEFVTEQGQSLLSLAYLLTGDRHLAEDITQTALADAYRHWRKVEAASSPEAYVRRMLVNAHISFQRRLWTTERPTDTVALVRGSSPEPGEALEQRQALAALVAGLAPRARTVLVLRYYEDLDDAAIAGLMGVSESSVRATASRALASLRGAAAPDAVKEQS